MDFNKKFILASLVTSLVLATSLAMIMLTVSLANYLNEMKSKVIVLEENVNILKSRIDMDDYICGVTQDTMKNNRVKTKSRNQGH